jgi:hypothetical protein
VPSDLVGLWCREVLTAPGFRDETTRVVWLQTQSWYGDLRVAADRPSIAAAGDLSAYDDPQLIALARVQGFAGQLRAVDGVCYWRRDMDLQPPSPDPDEGRYSISGDVMIEDGIHADYQEIWRRAADSTGPTAAFRRDAADGRAGLLVMAGRFLLAFVARADAGPPAGSLADAVTAALQAGDRSKAEDLLGACVRFCEKEGQGQWITTLSSQPWQEGVPIWRPGSARLDPTERSLSAGDDVWHLLETNLSLEALAAWLNVDTGD